MEFSLVVPILLLLLFGIIEFSLAIHTQVDYGNAVSNGIREATVDADKEQNDDLIASVLFQTMRQDDPSRANYYAIQLIQGRGYSGTDLNNLYENVYGYNHSTQAFEVEPFTSEVTTDFSIASFNYCAYYYQTHVASDGVTVYLDSNESIELAPTPSSGVSTHFANALSSIQGGCGRNLKTAPTTALTCTANGVNYSFMSSITIEGHSVSSGNLCYYYPSERVSSIDTVDATYENTLPDLVEVDVNYTYKPFGNYVTASTPLGLGFTVTEHARGRLEPNTKIE